MSDLGWGGVSLFSSGGQVLLYFLGSYSSPFTLSPFARLAPRDWLASTAAAGMVPYTTLKLQPAFSNTLPPLRTRLMPPPPNGRSQQSSRNFPPPSSS